MLKRCLLFIRLSVKRLQYRGKNQTAKIHLRIIVSCHRLRPTFFLCQLQFIICIRVLQVSKGYQPDQALEKENWIQNQEWSLFKGLDTIMFSFWQCPQPRWIWYVSVPRIYKKSSKEVLIGLSSQKWNKLIDYVNITSRQIDKKKINQCP